MHRCDRAPENRDCGVPHSIKEHDQCIDPCQRSQPARVICCQGSEGKTDGNGGNQAEEPFAEFKIRHREPAETGP